MTPRVCNPKTCFWGSVAGWTALHIVLAARLQISGDEAYYWSCARHFDWAYFDQPGLMIWPIALFRLIFGDTSLAVRAPAIVTSFVMAGLMLGVIRRLGGGYHQATVAYALLHLMPLFFFGSFYESTDIGMSAAYIGATWAAVAVAQGDRRGWWGFGLATGLGFLAKFPIVVVLPVIFVALGKKEARRDLATFTPWLAALMSLGLTAPVWIWAVLNQWDNISFQATRRIEDHSLTLEFLVNFFGANLVLVTPFLLIAIVIALLKFADEGGVDRWVVITAAVMPFVVFGLVSLRSPIGAHWGGPGILTGTVVLSLVAFRGRQLLVGGGAVVGLGLSAAVIVIAFAPELLMGMQWTYRGKPQEINTEKLARLVGNQEMADKLMNRVGNAEAVLMTSYSDTNLFAFLTAGKLPTRLAHVGRGKHGLASLYWYPKDDLVGKDLLFVTPKERLARVLPDYCTEYEELEPLEFVRDGHVIRRQFVYRCRGVSRDGGTFTR